MKDIVYKCLNEKCNAIFRGINKDGICCPACKTSVAPIMEFKYYHSKDVPTYNDLKKIPNIKVYVDMSEIDEAIIKVEKLRSITDSIKVKNSYGIAIDQLQDIAQDKGKPTHDRIRACELLIDSCYRN